MFPSAKMVFRRHVPPAQVSELKNSAFDLMTRSSFITQVPAEPKQSTTHRNARRIGKSVRPLRSAVRPKTTTTPASGPGYKLSGHCPIAARSTSPTLRNLTPHLPLLRNCFLKSLILASGFRCSILWQLAHTIARSSTLVSVDFILSSFFSGTLWCASMKWIPRSPYLLRKSKPQTSQGRLPPLSLEYLCFARATTLARITQMIM